MIIVLSIGTADSASTGASRRSSAPPSGWSPAAPPRRRPAVGAWQCAGKAAAHLEGGAAQALSDLPGEGMGRVGSAMGVLSAVHNGEERR